MSEWEDIYTCPVCKTNDCVPAGGNEQSKILIIGEFPGKEEIQSGRPFSGATGAVFRTELAKLGMDLYSMRICNMWIHEPNKNEKCLEYGIQQVIKEAKGKQAILLVGSDTVKYFCDKKVSKVNGLEVQSLLLSAPIIMALIQPATVFHGVVGELRFGLKQFVKKVEMI